MLEPAQKRAELVETCDRAALAYDDDDPRKARRLYQKALQLEDGSTTDDERFIVRKYLAECCYGTGKLEEAETYFREALALSELKIAAYGPQHDISISIRHNLAHILSKADDRDANTVKMLEEAISLYRQNIRLLVSDEDKFNLSDSRSSLAFCLGELAKRYGNDTAANSLRVEAANIYSDLLAMEVVADAAEGNIMIHIRHNYASVLYDMRQYQEAKEQFLLNETVLKDLPTKRRKNLELVVQETDSYLEACSEATNDLELSLRRRTTDPLDCHNKKAREKLHDSPRSTSGCDPLPAHVPVSHRARAESTLEVPTASPHLRRPKTEEPLTTKPDRGGQASPPKSASDAASPETGSRTRGKTISPRPRSPMRGELFENEFNTGHHADEWFLRLYRRTHSLLRYDDVQKRRQRVRVAVLDSGLHRPANERDPRQRADIRRYRNRLKEYKGMSASEDWIDLKRNMHGTNCASLVLQVAPHADLYIANVVAADGYPTAELVIDALKWALAKEREIDIITMSLGLDSFNHKISDLIDLARQKKVLVFASSPNKGDLANGVFPAMLPTVFDIKATTGLGKSAGSNPPLTDEKANFMFLGEEVAIPGLRNSARLSGNSYATPIAAGTAALVLDLSTIAQLWGMANRSRQTNDSNGTTAENVTRAGDPNESGEINMFPEAGLRVDTLLRKYEGMSMVFKQMSGGYEPGKYHYNVHPWSLLCKYVRDPFQKGSDEWRTYVRLCEELRKIRGMGQ